MESGSEFHKTEEACVKERSPYVFVEVGGTMNNDFELDLKVRVGRYNDKSSHK